MKLTVTNDHHQFHVPTDEKRCGIYTPSWGVVLEEARDRGYTSIEVVDEATGKVVCQEEALR